MKKSNFPVEALPDWCKRYGVELNSIKVADVPGRGIGWITTEDIRHDSEASEPPKPLLVIPGDVIVCREHVGHYAVQNAQFHNLLTAIGYEVSVVYSFTALTNTDEPR